MKRLIVVAVFAITNIHRRKMNILGSFLSLFFIFFMRHFYHELVDQRKEEPEFFIGVTNLHEWKKELGGGIILQPSKVSLFH